MKYVLLFLILLITYPSSAQDFDDYFSTGSMRVDFILAGDAQHLDIFLEQIKKEPYWGGTEKMLIDPFDYGMYKFNVTDHETGEIIFCPIINHGSPHKAQIICREEIKQATLYQLSGEAISTKVKRNEGLTTIITDPIKYGALLECQLQ